MENTKKAATKFETQSWKEYYENEVGEEFIDDPYLPEFCSCTYTVSGIVKINLYNVDCNYVFCTEFDYTVLNEKYREQVEWVMERIPDSFKGIPNNEIAKWICEALWEEICCEINR